jgi:diamine N-acetyltransferase
MMKFVKVENDRAIKRTAILADEIWREHYIPFIGKPQVDYMLEKFQSVSVIKHQLEKEAYEYFIIEDNGTERGYLAVVKNGEELYISKLYVKKGMRGAGTGRQAVYFIESLASARNFKSLSLNVNKGNAGSIAAYKKYGFEIIREEKNDIGNGFFMDDYVMKKGL